jgi:hypothetical protein
LLSILETVEKPVLIHYGSYESEFLERMGERYNSPLQVADQRYYGEAPARPA